MAEKTPGYDVSSITVLEGLEAVRKRPGMYIGTTDSRGLNHCLWEIIDNAVDEALAGHCTRIEVTLHKDGSAEVHDNGRGIPVDVDPKTGLSGVELVFTKLHAGGKFGGGGYAASGGLHGVGASVVNALSTRLDVEVDRNGKTHTLSFLRGTPGKFSTASPDSTFNPDSGLRLLRGAKPTSTGTRVRFWPDPRIFLSDASLDMEAIQTRARQTTFLVPGLIIVVHDARNDEVVHEEFYSEGGVLDFVAHISATPEAVPALRIKGAGSFVESVPVLDPDGAGLIVQDVERNCTVDIGLRWNTGYDTDIRTFVNIISTPKGGTHLVGFERSLTKTINEQLRALRILKVADESVTREDCTEGLAAVVTVSLPEPQFEGQTKEVLGTAAVSKVVSDVMIEVLQAFFQNPKLKSQSRIILDKISAASKARQAARAQREASRVKNRVASSALPGKLADCRTTDTERRELFLVEGDSAMGCFTADTRVATLEGGSLSFAELVRDWALGRTHQGYATNAAGQVVVVPLEEPRFTKQTQSLSRVTLSNGTTVECTPDHLFRLSTGEYARADALQPSIPLMTLHPNRPRVIDEIKAPELLLASALPLATPFLTPQSLTDFPVLRGPENRNQAAVLQTISHYPATADLYVIASEPITASAPVYDLTVDTYNNFALANGVFVHNSARSARDSEFQALLPLRGKILNTQKSSLADMLKNEECKSIVQVLGAGMGKNFDSDALRYGKVVLMTDADVDGGHIRCLLLTLFHRYMHPLVAEGRVYSAVPPLFRIRQGKDTFFAYSDTEKDQIIADLAAKNRPVDPQKINRYKGLGEMNAEQLAPIMDPTTRKLRRITMSDLDSAVFAFDLMMGKDVAPRKDFIIVQAGLIS